MRFADVFVVVATIIAWITLVPQIRRLLATGDPEGVSVTWPVIGFVSNAGWTFYLASQGHWAATPGTLGMVVFYLVVLRILARLGVSLLTGFLRGTAWATALTAIGATQGWAILGLVLGWSYALQLLPALTSSYRSRNPTGVSIGSWLLITIESVLWGIYGVLLDDLPIKIFAVTGVVAGSLIVARAATTRRTGGQPVIPPISSPEAKL
jgi:uncharacterized protein with PQ loop repeat